MIRQKQNSEKEKNELKIELEDVSQSLQSVTTAKINFEKQCKIMEDNIYEATQREKELARNIQEGNAVKDRLQSDNVDQLRQIDEKDGAIKNLIKLKNTQVQELDLIRSDLAEEERAKTALAKGLQTAQKEIDLLRDQCESEISAKIDLQRSLSGANAEVVTWRTKYEQDAIQRTEELEEAKKRLAEKLITSEEEVRSQYLELNILNKKMSSFRLSV